MVATDPGDHEALTSLELKRREQAEELAALESEWLELSAD